MKKYIIIVSIFLTLFYIVSAIYRKYNQNLRISKKATNDTYFQEIRSKYEANKANLIIHNFYCTNLEEPIIAFWIPDSTITGISNKNDTSWLYYDKNNFARVPEHFSYYYQAVYTKREVIDSLSIGIQDSKKRKGIDSAVNSIIPDNEFWTFSKQYTALFCCNNDVVDKAKAIIYDKEYPLLQFNKANLSIKRFLYGFIFSKKDLDSLSIHKLAMRRDTLAKKYYEQNKKYINGW